MRRLVGWRHAAKGRNGDCRSNMAFFKTKDVQKALAAAGEYLGQKIGSLFGFGRKKAEPGERIASEEDRFLYGEEWVPVTSSNLALIRYQAATKKLFIEFKNGATYSYGNVWPEEAKSLYAAGSKGKWVWDHLRIRKTRLGHQKPYKMETIGEYVSQRIKRANILNPDYPDREGLADGQPRPTGP